MVEERTKLLQKLDGIIDGVLGFLAKLGGDLEEGEEVVGHVGIAPRYIRRLFAGAKQRQAFFKYQRKRRIIQSGPL